MINPEERWMPQHGQVYFYVMVGGEVVRATWGDTYVEHEYWGLGLCFKTREEAEIVGKRVKAAISGGESEEPEQEELVLSNGEIALIRAIREAGIKFIPGDETSTSVLIADEKTVNAVKTIYEERG